MKTDPNRGYQALHQQIGRLLETAPDLSTVAHVNTKEAQLWLARAHALIVEVGIVGDGPKCRVTVEPMLQSSSYLPGAVQSVFSMLYRALAHCELRAPAAGGAFIPVGNSLDAFSAISKILSSAASNVLIVDPYLDEAALTEFGLAVPGGTLLRP